MEGSSPGAVELGWLVEWLRKKSEAHAGCVAVAEDCNLPLHSHSDFSLRTHGSKLKHRDVAPVQLAPCRHHAP